MYQALLTRRYLTSKAMPLLAMLAVTLSVGTVLVTWSVMGGFLEQLINAGRSLIGDATISWPNTGFPYYDDLILELVEDNRVTAAAPMIETFGVINLPDDRVQGVQIRGIDPASFKGVVGEAAFAGSIWWKDIDAQPATESADAAQSPAHSAAQPPAEPTDPRRFEQPPLGDTTWQEHEQAGLTLTEPNGDPAALLGIHVSGYNQRTSEGFYTPRSPVRATPQGDVRHLTSVWLPENAVTVHVMPLIAGGRGIDVVTRTVPVANEFFSGVYEIDSQVVMLRLDQLQRMLDMHRVDRIDPDAPTERFDPETGEIVPVEPEILGPTPPRATTILERAAPGLDAESQLKPALRDAYQRFAARHPAEVPPAQSIQIQSWRDLNRTKIQAVEQETGLVLFIFGLVSFTTAFLILAIFWSMVSEKTRDIGILRSMGASTPGVAWLWLRYGAAIGVVGSAAGLAMAALVVANINQIHRWLGETFGLVIWDPRVYLFVEIPTDLEWHKAAVVAGAGVLACLLGAAIPAWRAATMDPVKALRFE